MADPQQNSVVTLHRRVQLCLATSGAIQTIAPITQVVFGDGGVDLEGIPIPPVETQTALNNEVGRYPIDGVAYPLDPPTTARYTVTVPPNEMIDVPFSEAAIVDADGFLCAIRTFKIKIKDADIAFTFEFDDEF